MLSDKLKEQILQYLRDKTGLQDWILKKPHIKARTCMVYRFSCSTYSTDIALKIYSNNTAGQQLQNQYQALKDFSVKLNKLSSQYRVAEPYGSLNEDNCFLMEWAPGESLDYRLWRYVYSEKHQFLDIRQTYCWLKKYHQVAKSCLQKTDVSYFSDQLEQYIQSHKGQTLLEEDVVFSEGIKVLKAQLSIFLNFRTMHANLHGDFTPTNILIGSEVITAIDMGRGASFPIEIDMALMLNYIVIDYPNMLTKRHMKKAPETWSILNTVLDAYEYPSSKAQRQFFLIIFLYQMLRRWLIINDRNKNNPRIIDRWRLRNSARIVEGISEVLNQ